MLISKQKGYHLKRGGGTLLDLRSVGMSLEFQSGGGTGQLRPYLKSATALLYSFAMKVKGMGN